MIGAGHAGGRFAQRMTDLRPDCLLTLIGREPTPPYERPPLSKDYLLGNTRLDKFAIWPGEVPPQSVELRLRAEAVAIDRHAKIVRLADEQTIPYDVLVIATGRRARKLGIPGEELRGVHTLRTVGDADALAACFATCSRLVIVGGGLIGLEVAAAAREKGVAVTVLETARRVLERVAPAALSDTLHRRHVAAGVRIVRNVRAISLEGGDGGAVRAVVLEDRRVECDCVLVAAGAVPEMELAAGAGLQLDKAIAVDNRLRTSDPSIYAIGDVAAYWSKRFACRIYAESWHHADRQAETLARILAGSDEVYDQAPQAWSDQYELTLNVVGNGNPAAPTLVRKRKSDDEMHFQLSQDGRLLAAWSLGPRGVLARNMRVASRLIEMDAMVEAAALVDPTNDLRTLLSRPSATRG